MSINIQRSTSNIQRRSEESRLSMLDRGIPTVMKTDRSGPLENDCCDSWFLSIDF